MSQSRSRGSEEQPIRPEVRWVLGCAVAGLALLGTVILVLSLALVLELPNWANVLIAVGLVLGGVTLAWLIASGLSQSRKPTGPRPVESEEYKPGPK